MSELTDKSPFQLFQLLGKVLLNTPQNGQFQMQLNKNANEVFVFGICREKFVTE